MTQVNDNVKVINEQNSRVNQAGVVMAVQGKKVTVRMDVDYERVDFEEIELEFLGR